MPNLHAPRAGHIRISDLAPLRVECRAGDGDQSHLRAVRGPQPPAASGLSDKEKALLQKINAFKAPRWRPFGACSYDWSASKLMAAGVRTTSVQCGGTTTPSNSTKPATTRNIASVAVHSDTLKLSIRGGDQT